LAASVEVGSRGDEPATTAILGSDLFDICHRERTHA